MNNVVVKNFNENEVSVKKSDQILSIMPSNFDEAVRFASALSKSNMVPANYKNNAADCMIALTMSMTLNVNVIALMYGMQPVQGKPCWESKLLVSIFNQDGRFSSVRYEYSGTPRTDDWTCVATTIEKSTGEKLVGPEVSVRMAKESGWYSKGIGVWKNQTQLMLGYRAAKYLINLIAPEICFGMLSRDEVLDISKDEASEVYRSEERKVDVIVEDNEPEDVTVEEFTKEQPDEIEAIDAAIESTSDLESLREVYSAVKQDEKMFKRFEKKLKDRAEELKEKVSDNE